jgi:hypothetical protein
MRGKVFRKNTFSKGTNRAQATCPRSVKEGNYPFTEMMRGNLWKPTFGRDAARGEVASVIDG